MSKKKDMKDQAPKPSPKRQALRLIADLVRESLAYGKDDDIAKTAMYRELSKQPDGAEICKQVGKLVKVFESDVVELKIIV